MLESAADRLYLPEYRILDHQRAKSVCTMLAERTDCPDKVRYKCYCRMARISYLALQVDEGDKYAAKALEIYPAEIEPLMLGADYEWYTHRAEYSDLYRYGKLPRIKALVDARRWQAMAYLLDKLIPLQDEGMRPYAELCETVLKETYRHSGETNYDAIAPVAFWEFIEFTDYRKFARSWYDDQLIKGIQSASHQAMYYFAFIEELTASILLEQDNEKGAKIHINKAISNYRKCVGYLDRRAMAGLVDMMLECDHENSDLPIYIKCLRAFSYIGQEYKCLGDVDDEDCDDEYPDDDGRFDPYV